LRSTSNFKVVANCSKQDLSFQDLIYLGQVYLLLEADYECASDLQITAQSHDPINIKKKTSLLINAHRDLLMSKLEKLNFPESLKREHHAILARCIGNLAKPEFGDKKKLAFGLRCLELYKKGNLRVLNATANAILQTA
jgi:hypothetical protein